MTLHLIRQHIGLFVANALWLDKDSEFIGSVTFVEGCSISLACSKEKKLLD